MKNFVHTVASCCIVVWLIGYLVYDAGGSFHYFLLIALVTASARVLMERRSRHQKAGEN